MTEREPNFLLPKEERRKTMPVPVELPISQRLRDTDARSTEIAVKPSRRVTLESMKDKIESVEYYYPKAVPHMTIAIAVTATGFAIVGYSTPADPANFNVEYGRELALEQVFRQMWPLEAYLLREEFSKEGRTTNMGDPENTETTDQPGSGAQPQPDDPKNPAEKELEKDNSNDDGDDSDESDEDDDDGDGEAA